MDNQTGNFRPLQNIPHDGRGNISISAAGNPGSPNLYPVIDSLAGWMKFLGIFTIVMGSITCLGIITTAIGVPMIFSGISLYKASVNLKLYKNFNNPFTLNEFFFLLNKHFKIRGIFVIIALVLLLLYIAIFLITLTIIGTYSIID